MSAYSIAPIMSIPSALFQAVQNSPDDLAMATDLLRMAFDLDFLLATACETRKIEGGTEYLIDCRLMSRQAANEVFLRIRGRHEHIQRNFPLLAPAADLLDYTAQLTINIAPMTQQAPKPFATVTNAGTSLFFPWEKSGGLEWGLALYFGISPMPLFFDGLAYSHPDVAKTLSPFGFGVASYLAFAAIPALAMSAVPADIARQWSARSIARDGVRNTPDGSYLLEVS